MPQWIDTYDYAIRTEMPGLGLYRNRNAQPQWTFRELSPKLLEAPMGKSAAGFRKKAQGYAKLSRSRPEGIGTDFAAQFILNRIH